MTDCTVNIHSLLIYVTDQDMAFLMLHPCRVNGIRR